MDLVVPALVVVALFGLGVGVGLFARRRAGLTASLEARLAAGLELRAYQERLEVLSTGLARADASRQAAERELELRRLELSRSQDALGETEARADELAQQLSDERSAAARLGAQHDAATRRFEEAARELDAASAQADAAELELDRLRVENARLGSQLEAEHHAQAAGQRVLDEKGQVMLERSRESLEGLLEPLRERLKQFEEKVEKTYDQENRDRASLLQHLKQLQESQSALHRDAENLSRALSGQSRARGEWGEVVLARLLEVSGLTEGREYRLQVTHVDEDGGIKRPDALVYLPGNRAVVVDAKCPLSAFVQAAAAETPEAVEALLDAHVSAVRSQVGALSDKHYTDVIEGRTLDVVMMFIPNEAAFQVALTRAPGLYEDAIRQRVHLCSPTTLLPALQLIAQVWRTEKQNVHARQIADEAARLLDKLAAFEEVLDGVGRKLSLASEGWEDAKKKLLTGRGSVRRHATKMVELGARLPQNDRALGTGVEPPDDPGEDEDEPQRALELELGPGKVPSA